MRTLININVQMANHGLLYLPLLSKWVCWLTYKKYVFQSLSQKSGFWDAVLATMSEVGKYLHFFLRHGSGMFIETVGWSPHLEIPHQKTSKCQLRINITLDPGWSNQIQGVPSLAAVSNGNPQPIPTKSQRASTMTNQKCLVPSKIERICVLIIIQIWGFGGKLEFEALEICHFVGDFNHQSQVMRQQLSTFAGIGASLPNMLCFCRVPSALVAPETRKAEPWNSASWARVLPSNTHLHTHIMDIYIYRMEIYIYNVSSCICNRQKKATFGVSVPFLDNAERALIHWRRPYFS